MSRNAFVLKQNGAARFQEHHYWKFTLQKCEVLTSVIVSAQISLVVSIGTTDKTFAVDVHLALMSSFYCREVPCSDERGTTSRS